MHELDASRSVGPLQQWATFTRWFREHNVAWRGTPSELLFQLTNNGAQNRAFTDVGGLLQFITENTEALRRAGIHATVERPPGQLMRVCLESAPAASSEKSAPEAVATRDVQRVQTRIEPTQTVSKASTTTGNRFPAQAGKRSSVQSSRRRVPLFVLIGIVAAILIIGFAIVITRRGGEVPGEPQSQAQSTSSPDTSSGGNAEQAVDASPNDLRSVALEELIRDAGVSKSPFAEEELAARYMEGRGTQRDLPAAYTWLVLARANGSDRDDDAIHKLGNQLSPEELQKVRVYLGNSYARGIGVARNLVTAHSWFELAEAAGSKDATTMKRSLEESMTPEQIRQAQARTAAWRAQRQTARTP